MKTFMKSLKKQDGFTLVELMVVVAIIGLLSAVAIPNFKKYQAKSKMSEAKLQLSALYTAEAAFFSDFNIYSNCLGYMGFDPNPEKASRYYAVGFTNAAAIDANAHAAAVNSGLVAAQCPAANGASMAPAAATTQTPTTATWFDAMKGVGSVRANAANFIPATALGNQANTAAMTFTAGAGGVIDGGFITNANCSQLTITNAKVVSIVRNGY